MNARPTPLGIKTLFAIAAGALLSGSAQADVLWQGPANGSASFNTPADWVGGVVPSTTGVNADNNNGSNSVITISATDPTWTHGDQRLGDVANSSGTAIQTGSTNIVGTVGGSWFREGDSAGSAGYYWLSNGVMQVGGNTHVGEVGYGYFEMDGGTLNQPGTGGIFVMADSDQSGGTPTGIFVMNAGTVNSYNQIWIGEGDAAGTAKQGTGYLIMNGGTINCTNWFVMGRSDGIGTMNMTNGTVNQRLNQFQIAPIGTGHSVGTLNLAGGAINIFTPAGSFDIADGTTARGTVNLSGTGVLTCQPGGDVEYWIGNNGFATNNMSGGQLIVNNWMAVGRGGNGVSIGVLNLSGGTITKQGANHISVASFANGTGTINQTGGYINQTVGITWLGQAGVGVWNMSGGTNSLANGMTNGSAITATGTLNLSGGIMGTAFIRGGAGISYLNMNGGTIRALANTPAFISGISSADDQSGGVTIDSQGFSITIPQSLFDSGGLTKIGTGALTLSGANNYSGPTVVNQGTLAITDNSIQSGGGSYTVADGSGLGVSVSAYQNAQMTMSDLTLGNTTGATLNFSLGAFGNPTAAPVYVTGPAVINGTITVNVADSLYTVGEIPLVQAATGFTGSGNFVLGSLPPGVQGYLTLDTTTYGSPTEVLMIISAGLPKWAGILSDGITIAGNWDINTTANWIEQSTSAWTTYKEGNPVLFDDTATGTTTINLVTNLHPSVVTFTNDALAYTLGGTGSIGGTTPLILMGTNTVTINTTNSYTGPTELLGSSELMVTNLANGGLASAIGASSSNPTNLVLGGGGLGYSGPTMTVNRGFILQNTNSFIDAESNLSFSGPVLATNLGVLYKVGPGQLTLTGGYTNQVGNGNGANGSPMQAGFRVLAGTLAFDGSVGGQYITNSGEFWVGSSTNQGANLVLNNTRMSSTSWAGISRGNGASNYLSTLTMNNSTLALANMSIGYDAGLGSNLESSVTTLNNSTITNLGTTGFNFAESAEIGTGSTHTLYLNGSSQLGMLSRTLIAMGGNTVASIYVSNTSSIFDTSYMSDGDGGNGFMQIANNGSVTTLNDFNVSDIGANSVGTLVLQDNGQLNYNNFYVGKGLNGVANILGGTLASLYNTNATTVFQVGVNASVVGSVLNQSGGTVLASNNVSIGFNSGAIGTINASGGLFEEANPAGFMDVGNSGTGVLNLSNTASVLALGTFAIGVGNVASGTVNLSGGTLTVQGVAGGSGLSTFNFNGGTLVAGPNASATFLSGMTVGAYLQSGGAIINSGTNVVSITQALLDGGGGGLTKQGTGTLDLMSSGNTYTGSTLVSAGAFGGTGTLVGPVTVGAAGTLAPGTPAAIGTLTVNNNLTLSGNLAVKVNKALAQSNDLVVVSGTLTSSGSGTVSVSNLGVALNPGDTFALFSKPVSGGAALTITGGGVANWVNNLAVDGSISVGSSVSLTPVTVTNSYSGGNLNLSWPTDHTGWRLVVQTNNLAAGLSANTNDWMTVAGSTTTNQESIPVNVALPAEFYRLIYP